MAEHQHGLGLRVLARQHRDAQPDEVLLLGEHLREGCRALPEPNPLDVFDLVYAEQTPELAEQKAGYAAYLSTFEEAHA